MTSCRSFVKNAACTAAKGLSSAHAKWNKLYISAGTAFFCSIFIFAHAIAQPASKPEWSAFQFLLGEWIGGGSGDPGRGTGGFSLMFDLDERILVRHNRSEYPATKDRPGFTHNDLMVIYPAHGKSLQAMYFDNEGHIINYSCAVSQGGDTATFVSAEQPETPRFRLSYVKKAVDTVLIRFEIAPPSRPEEFVKYLEGLAYRAKTGSVPKSGEKQK